MRSIQVRMIFIFVSEHTFQLHKGPFTNHVTQFSRFFDHPPTCSYALTVILTTNYSIKVSDGYIFANHPPTSNTYPNL